MNPADFARLFDAQNRAFTEDIPYWLKLADQFGDPVLELGCGAGRVLLPLADAGHRIHGVDNNPHMLERLASRVQPETEARVTTELSDLSDLQPTRHYQLIIAPCNTLAAFDDQTLGRLCQRLSSALMPGGALAFEAPPADGGNLALSRDEVLDTFYEPQHDVHVQLSASESLDPDRRVASVTWNYDEMKHDGSVERHQQRMTYHLRTPATHTEILHAGGFGHVHFRGDYEGGPYTDGSALLLVVARTT